MLDQNMVDDLKANAERLRNTTQTLYEVTQEVTPSLSDKDIAQKIVAVEGYLELVKGGTRDVNKSRKMMAQELNANAGIGE